MEKIITKEEAFKKGYLQKKKVYLRPVIRGGKLVTSPDHIAFFQMEGAGNWFQLPLNGKTGELVNPFVSDEERMFFEQELDVDLNTNKRKDNFWKTFFVKIVKDRNLMERGYEFDLSDPMDNLRWRVVKLQDSVAPDWESRYNRGEYRFALVDEEYEDKRANDETNKKIEAYTYLGSIQNSAKQMKDLLSIYYMEKKMLNQVPEDADREWLKKELKRVIEEEVDLFLSIVNDPSSKIKNFIVEAIRAGAINKSARNKYDIPGEGTSYTYDELVVYLTQAEEVKADVYLKMVAQINMLREGKSKIKKVEKDDI